VTDQRDSPSAERMVIDNSSTVYERRLPVYLLLDCSSTMMGAPIAAMEMGLQTLLEEISTEPLALDTVWFSVLTFGSTAEVLVPLTDIEEFQFPSLVVEGTTAMGACMRLLKQRLDCEVRKSSLTQKGDWKPLAFLFTDGKPTDDWEEIVDEFRNSDVATLIACGAGPDAEDSILMRISKHVMRLEDTSPGKLASFLDWVSTAITTAGNSVGTGRRISEILPTPKSGVIITK
jgi:uncharacterized protein YegL